MNVDGSGGSRAAQEAALKRRLLIVAMYCPPSPEVGGLRWWGLARYLARLDWDVTMLVSGDHRHPNPAVPPGVTVELVGRSRTLQDRYRSWRARSAGPQTSPVTAAPALAANGSSRTLLHTARTSLSDLMAFPDDARGWLGRAFVRGRMLIRASRPDAIISTGPPHSLHVLSMMLSRAHGIPWFVDYRDPWVIGAASPLAARWLRTLRDDVHRTAAGVIVTTPELATEMHAQLGTTPVYFLSNGVDASVLPSRVEPSSPGLSVVHMGALYFNRDPTPLVDAFGRFVMAHPAAARDGSDLRFIGTAEGPFRTVLEQKAQDPALGGRVQFSPPVPREEALKILAGASLAVVLAQNQSVMVPAKLYESVAIGVPTLVITESGSASAAAARRVGAVQRDPSDVAGIAGVFEAAWRRDPSIRPKPDADITHDRLAESADRILRACGTPYTSEA